VNPNKFQMPSHDGQPGPEKISEALVPPKPKEFDSA
jgi:hypothetical protein